MLTFENLLEALNRIRQWNVFARKSCKLLCYMEWLLHELLYLSCSGNNDLILLGKLIHTKDCDDILQFLILLQNLLYTTCHLVMLLANHSWIEDSGSRLQRICLLYTSPSPRD